MLAYEEKRMSPGLDFSDKKDWINPILTWEENFWKGKYRASQEKYTLIEWLSNYKPFPNDNVPILNSKHK